eukprot:gene57556-biopygen47350
MERFLRPKSFLALLAGSERNKMSRAEGDRLYEATRINLSLSTLRRVIDTLLENSHRRRGQPLRHSEVYTLKIIPYRESTLTHILSDSLGGNSKTIMLATVSPAESNREDTVNTLNYANKAKDIVNTVDVNEQKGAPPVGAPDGAQKNGGGSARDGEAARTPVSALAILPKIRGPEAGRDRGWLPLPEITTDRRGLSEKLPADLVLQSPRVAPRAVV